jgi:DNA primase
VPLIDPESVEQVRQAADLVELLRGRVELVRRGGRWWARCPFHEERSPSFTILPDHRRYHCFGCGAQGDAITWMREREGAGSFNEAIEALADRFGVELRYQQASAQEEAQRAAGARRMQLLDRAADFYVAYLWRADEAEPARRYLADRGFGEELLRRYRVGYAPRAGNLLARRARDQGYGRQELVDAGLARQNGADFFSARIMFPIADARGRVQGFGGRTLDPGERAKYVNSPEGPTFRKRRLLFALDQARASAARAGWVAVAEGYTDVLALAKAGVDAAVACMGTSLTNEQLRLLARTAGEVRLCFDGDAAGQEAAWRSVEAAGGVAVRLSAVPLPSGSDPGDLAGTEDGLARLRAAVESPTPMMSYLVRSRVGRAGPTAGERDEALADVTSLLRRFPDSIEKDDAVRLAAGLLGLSRPLEDRLRASVASGVTDAPVRTARATGRLGPDEARERRLLAIAVAVPDVAERYLAELSEEAFDLPIHRRAYSLLAAGERVERWPDDLEPLGIELQASASDEPPAEAELREATYRLQERSLERRAHRAREEGRVQDFLRLQELLQRLRGAIRAGNH